MKPILKTLTLLLCLAPAAAVAEDTIVLPSVKDVLTRNVEALGGAEAMRKLDHRTVNATFEMVEMGMKADMVVQQAAPNKMIQRVTIEGLGEERAGHDGTTAWQLSMMAGPSILDGDAKRQFLRDADFYFDLNFEDWYEHLEVVGYQDWGGERCVVVEARNGEGPVDKWYFSEATGLGRGFQGTAETEMGQIATELTVSDYEEIDGIRAPRTLTSKLMGQTQRITVQSITHEPFDHSVFLLPQEIAVLVGDDE